MASIFDAVRTARSGLGAFGAAVGVVGNNIANALTPGFKASRPEFTSLVPGGQGQGVSFSSAVRLIEQGTIEPTSRNLDVAISGDGLFVVDTGVGQSFSRAGAFSINSSGTLVNDQGFPVLGYAAGGNGGLEQLTIQGNSSVSPTTQIAISGNLDAREPVAPPPPVTTVAAGSPPPGTEPVSFADLATSSQFSTVVDVTDSLGGSREVSLYFTKTAPDEFTVQAFARSEDVDPSGASVGAPRLLGSTTLQFGPDGRRSTIPAPPSQDFTGIVVPFQGGADPTQQVSIDLGDFTQFATSSSVASITKDGLGAGEVLGVSVESSGEVFLTFSNGEERSIGVVALADFPNPAGLTPQGGNLLGQTLDSGQPTFNRPGTGGVGTLESGALEGSNVDLVTEFVDLMSYTRGFQANAKVLQVTGELADELVDKLA